jgi:hypothetical protein
LSLAGFFDVAMTVVTDGVTMLRADKGAIVGLFVGGVMEMGRLRMCSAALLVLPANADCCAV